MVPVSRRPWFAPTALVALVALAAACGSSKHKTQSPIGSSLLDEDFGADEGLGLGGAPARDEQAPGAETAAAPAAPGPEEEAAQAEAAEAAREAAFGARLLAEATTPSDGSGLVFALGQRASDLPWTLAIENRSDQTLELAADPQLLHFELVPEERPVEPSSQPATKKAPVPPKPVVCGPAKAPQAVGDDAWLTLAPGQILTYSFDPRSLCEQAGSLEKGTKIAARFGFPVETKKVWAGGKMTETPLLDKAPFVARYKLGGAERPLLPKELVAEPFELDETYPLHEVRAKAFTSSWADRTASSEPGEGSASGDAEASAAGPHAPGNKAPPELALSVNPLGSTDEVDETTVTFSVKNQSPKSVQLFLRRELVVYEVLGPAGASTCRMYPAGRAPDRSSFDTLGSGSARTLTTRLAEACPPSTFVAPGTYAVSARLEARDAGTEHGFSAFVGDVTTERPARFVVRGGKKKTTGPRFRVANNPTSPSPAARPPSAAAPSFDEP